MSKSNKNPSGRNKKLCGQIKIVNFAMTQLSDSTHTTASRLPDFIFVFLSWRVRPSLIVQSGSSCLKVQQARYSSIKWPESVLEPMFALISVFYCATWSHVCDIQAVMSSGWQWWVLTLYLSSSVSENTTSIYFLLLYRTKSNTHFFYH